MSWKDWIGYPGMSEDNIRQLHVEVTEKTVEQMQQMATSVSLLIGIAKALDVRLTAVEGVLRTHGLAK